MRVKFEAIIGGIEYDMDAVSVTVDDDDDDDDDSDNDEAVFLEPDFIFFCTCPVCLSA